MIFNRKGNDLEVIDGQQRLIVIYMILDFLQNTYGTEKDIFERCELELQNFVSYKQFVGSEYGMRLTENDKNNILEKDLYGQSIKFEEIYQLIKENEYLSTKGKALELYENLCKACFNIIISDDYDRENCGIEYFLDVNLKGLKLDDEDIFKGYLFSLDSSDEMVARWNKIKRLIFEINTIREDVNYTLCNFLQHFLYCFLYDEEKYRGITFGADFLIEKMWI